MADAGNEGQSEAQAFSENFSIAGESLRTGWAEAVAKDEHAERVQKSHRHTPVQTSRYQSRSDWRTRQDWHRTVRGIQRQYAAWSDPSSPYSKGSDIEKGPGLFAFILQMLGLS